MAELAIRGHKTRGKEVIELLEMLGGKTRYDKFEGHELSCGYYIKVDGYIGFKHYSLFDDTTIFTLEEFLEKFPYKVGDKVQHKGATSCGSAFEVEKMRWVDNQVKYTILWYNNCRITVTAEDLQPYKEVPVYLNEKVNKQTEEIAEILEPAKEIMEGVYAYDEINCYHQDFADKVRIRLGNDFETKVEGKITYIVKKQPQYPKTYEECCKVLPLGEDGRLYTKGYKASLIQEFQQLLICRDAYWKIAGEQMGLGKSWGPDWKKHNKKYIISVFKDTIIYFENETYDSNTILAFPTAEMRDAFLENFKELIELCKELL